ncbi:alpha/beta fold hydrolase [Actinomadura fibrosa]|uniref:Alpha/beta fold hydrolase n=1 Tax=Actinomadura fibrosa TaxID=111802 RepID=A0ABW2XKP9_9ACTN|nr:alpha/beta hydrolase [Actinomadura fibrosa]
MPSDPAGSDTEYDEFGLFHENAEEAGLPWSGPPLVRRESVEVGPGQRISALVWGDGPPEVVLLHGGAQNAHTWDTVALALDRPLVALDLPGHGHSDRRADRDYLPVRNAEAVAAAVERLAPDAGTVVGMSLGGLTAIRLAARRPDLVRRLVVVDVTPGVTPEKAAPITNFVNGPETFGSLDELLERTVAFNPGRSVSSLRRGILHNTVRSPDGTWRWRWDRFLTPGAGFGFGALWDDLGAVKAPALLVRGALSGVVSDEDAAEFARRVPHARVETVEGAGHSVQGDRPVELARLIDGFATDGFA